MNCRIISRVLTENCLRYAFGDLSGPRTISININIDGLPLFNNGTDQVWPVLFNVQEEEHIRPMIIGMFHGKSKPKRVEEFLEPFVEEALPILISGILINGHQLNVKIRSFICDSPARAFIKGNIIIDASVDKCKTFFLQYFHFRICELQRFPWMLKV